jgi:hypothetical protein
VDPEPINLIRDARKNIQLVNRLVSGCGSTKSINILSRAVELSLNALDDALRAMLMSMGIRVKDWSYAIQLISQLMPGNPLDPGLKDQLISCLFKDDCDLSSLMVSVREVNRFVDYAYSVVTHRVMHMGP